MSGRRPIAVFGSSEPLEGQPLYEQARRIGELLARAGYPVLTGGYGGVMEAASKGAVEAGGRAIGVTCDVFDQRSPNRFLTKTLGSSDLHERTRKLIHLAGGFVVLRGKAGTLAEVSFLWALHRAGCLEGRPVIVLEDGWREFVEFARRADLLEPPQLEVTRVAGTPEEVLAALAELLPAEEP